MSTPEVYFISGSAPCWRVMLAFAVKGVEYDPRRLDNSRQEQKAPEFLAINPKGTVPVLKAGDTVIRESLAILAWLEAAHPSPPLFGTNPAQTGRMFQRVLEFDATVTPLVGAITRPAFRGKAAEEAESIRTAAQALQEPLREMERALGRSTHLAGDGLSVVDIYVYPTLMSLARACEREDMQALELGIAPFARHFPDIAGWVGRMKAFPGHSDAYPPHWKQSAA